MCIADIVGGWLSVCPSVCALNSCPCRRAPASHRPPRGASTLVLLSRRRRSEHPVRTVPLVAPRPPRWGLVGFFFGGGDATARVQRSSLGNLISRGGRLRKKKKKNDRRHQLFCGHICVKKHQAVSCGFGVLPFLFPSPEV